MICYWLPNFSTPRGPSLEIWIIEIRYDGNHKHVSFIVRIRFSLAQPTLYLIFLGGGGRRKGMVTQLVSLHEFLESLRSGDQVTTALE